MKQKRDNPQLGDGHTHVANELLEVLMRSHLSNYERRMVDCIVRYDSGLHRKTRTLSLSFIAMATGILLPHVSRAKKKLLHRKILTQTGNKEVALNKKYQEWEVTQRGNKKLPKEVIKVTQRGNKKLPKEVTRKIIKNIKKRKEKIRKSEPHKRMQYLRNLPLSDIKKFKEKFKITEQQIRGKADDLVNYCQAHGKRYKDYRAFLRGALKRDFAKQKQELFPGLKRV